MKLGTIVQARDRGSIALLSEKIPLADGRKRYKLRKLIAALEGELRTADAERTRIVIEAAPDTRMIDQTNPRFAEVAEKINAFYDADVETQIEPILTQDDLNGITMTVAEERGLYDLGIVAEETPATPEKKPKGRK